MILQKPQGLARTDNIVNNQNVFPVYPIRAVKNMLSFLSIYAAAKGLSIRAANSAAGTKPARLTPIAKSIPAKNSVFAKTKSSIIFSLLPRKSPFSFQFFLHDYLVFFKSEFFIKFGSSGIFHRDIQQNITNIFLFTPFKKHIHKL